MKNINWSNHSDTHLIELYVNCKNLYKIFFFATIEGMGNMKTNIFNLMETASKELEKRGLSHIE